MTDDPWKCPDDTKHVFKDLRQRMSQHGPPFYFFQRCKRCNALKTQTVDIKTQPNGDRVPAVSVHIDAGDSQQAV